MLHDRGPRFHCARPRRTPDLDSRARMTTSPHAAFARRAELTRYAWLSIAAACATIGLKTAAYALTGSVGLLSDAAESLVNLVGAVMALAMLKIAARPPDEDHHFGHG